MVNIDTVYQNVLALANKEQRGYITPQEFNLFADQAQMEIFEQYFYDINQFKRRPSTSSPRYDIVESIKEKISIFNVNSLVVTHGFTLPDNIYRIGDCWATTTNNPTDSSAIQIELIDQEDLVKSQAGPLIKATEKRPIFYLHHNQVYFQPQTITGKTYRINAIKRPTPPNWTYLIDSDNQNALYNSTATDHQDFELHASEEPKLIVKILQLAGVSIKDFNLAQSAAQKEISVKQQEKQ